jgi:transcription-repair coupling factor (superfamily II helicase)
MPRVSPRPPATAAAAAAAPPVGDELKNLTRLIQRARGFPEVIAALRNGRAATIDGAWGSAAGLVSGALALHAPTCLVVVLAHVGDVDDFRDDVAVFSGLKPEVLPAWERLPREQDARDEVFGARTRVVGRLTGGLPPKVVVTSIQALLQPVPRPDVLRRMSRRIRVGDVTPVDDLASWLMDRGMQRVEVVEVAGEFSLRGGILDVFPTDSADPVRIEFFGDDVESIRPFDAETQRSLDRWEDVTIAVPPAFDPDRLDDFGPATDAFPEGTWAVLVEQQDLREEGRQYLSRAEDPRGLYTVESTFERLVRRPTIALSALAADSLEATCHLRIESVERFSGELSKVKDELESAAGGDRVVIACHNAAEAERLREVFADSDIARDGRLVTTVGRVRAGFHLTEGEVDTLVIADHELFARADVRRATSRRRYETRAIDSFLDLSEGDLVVHVNHGIAKYLGLQFVDKAGDHAEETLLLEFAEKTKLYVPIAKIDLVQKYVGGGKIAPPLSKIGSSAWDKRKKRVEEAVVDLAQELLDIQADRASEPGFAFPAVDSRWIAEFEAAFPFDETPDQLSAIDAVKDDMTQTRPMDRLICGDVGYGKTEVAIRAAFRAVDAGKQVGILVPTTILSEQHHRSFAARMGEFPFVIEVVNRFRAKSEIRDVLKRAAEGKVDVLIGTHRILQKDVAFKDLGLIVVDEEQRFGVEDKEWLKTLRSTVDVLTLSATPIPRTLHMSLLGIRDISNLETPPSDRKAIETRILRYDPDTIRRAINRELNRDGQVYFVHNRIHDIEQVVARLQSIVPEARIEYAHGQMAGERLEKTMLRFINREFDVLVATTIIESGLDIPNANTIFINEADKYGLADLHQLRGRVGRFKHRAYAYLLLESDRPVTPNAVKRLKAIEEFTSLGAGFKIALRDLEIRGAGNILGAEQSGHIESVGYELYCSLLESAVRKATRQPSKPLFDCSVELKWRAYLPRDYVPAPRLKLELYRRLARLRTLDHLTDFRKELNDRFGPPPKPAENLLAEAEIRILAGNWKVDRIHVEAGYAVLTYRDAKRIETLARRHKGRVRVVDAKKAYIPLGDDPITTPQIVAVLKELLSAKR